MKTNLRVSLFVIGIIFIFVLFLNSPNLTGAATVYDDCKTYDNVRIVKSYDITVTSIGQATVAVKFEESGTSKTVFLGTNDNYTFGGAYVEIKNISYSDTNTERSAMLNLCDAGLKSCNQNSFSVGEKYNLKFNEDTVASFYGVSVNVNAIGQSTVAVKIGSETKFLGEGDSYVYDNVNITVEEINYADSILNRNVKFEACKPSDEEASENIIEENVSVPENCEYNDFNVNENYLFNNKMVEVKSIRQSSIAVFVDDSYGGFVSYKESNEIGGLNITLTERVYTDNINQRIARVVMCPAFVCETYNDFKISDQHNVIIKAIGESTVAINVEGSSGSKTKFLGKDENYTFFDKAFVEVKNISYKDNVSERESLVKICDSNIEDCTEKKYSIGEGKLLSFVKAPSFYGTNIYIKSIGESTTAVKVGSETKFLGEDENYVYGNIDVNITNIDYSDELLNRTVSLKVCKKAGEEAKPKILEEQVTESSTADSDETSSDTENIISETSEEITESETETTEETLNESEEESEGFFTTIASFFTGLFS